MDYTLAVLTHGNARTLPRTLRSFVENVSPAPSRVVVFGDAAAVQLTALVFEAGGFEPQSTRVVMSREQKGFCESTRALWKLAVGQATDYVFWLEHDFEFLRPVDLSSLAALLDGDNSLAQVALVRGPANDRERAAGGLVQARPGEFTMRWEVGSPVASARWLAHRSFFTTNPSLMRRSFMANNVWPDYGAECEGRYGIDLVARGYRFAFWGHGEQWVNHTGVRDGFGY